MKKNEYRFPVQTKGFALLKPTIPFLKGLTPKSMNLFQESIRFSTTREFFGSRLSVERKLEFCAKTVWRKKKNLHVFPLRGAKENKGFSPLDTHKPLKRLDLNFLASLFGSFSAI